MIVLDVTVVNVDLGLSSAALAWVVNAYLIAFGGLLLLAGRLGDLISRRGVLPRGLACSPWPRSPAAPPRARHAVGARFVQGSGER